MEFQTAQKEVDALIEDLGGYWPVMNILARLTEELGELSAELQGRRREPGPGVEEEIGDVLFALLALSNTTGVDAGKALRKVMDKYIQRDLKK